MIGTDIFYFKILIGDRKYEPGSNIAPIYRIMQINQSGRVTFENGIKKHIHTAIDYELRCSRGRVWACMYIYAIAP